MKGNVLAIQLSAGFEMEAADLVNRAIETGRIVIFFWFMSDYDKDPRELDQIPEAREAIMKFSTLISDKAYNIMEENNKAIIGLCDGTAERIPGGKILVNKPFRGL